MTIFKFFFFFKCPKVFKTLYFKQKKTLTLEAQKCASKVMDWVKTPPPLRKNSITNLLFFRMAFSEHHALA